MADEETRPEHASAFRLKAAGLQDQAREKDLESTREWVFRRIQALQGDHFGRDETDPNVGYIVTKAGNVVHVTIGPVDGSTAV